MTENIKTQEELYKSFESAALKNIAADRDLSSDERYEFLNTMNQYGKYFHYEYSEVEEEQKQSLGLIQELFVFLFEDTGGSHSDYLAYAISMATRDTNICLKVNSDSLSRDSEFGQKAIEQINRFAFFPDSEIENLKKYGIFTK